MARYSAALAGRLHIPRAIGLALGGVCVAAALHQSGERSAWVWALLALHAFAWPHIAWAVATRAALPAWSEYRNLLLDSLFGAFWVPVMGFNLLPSTAVLTMLAMNNMAVGGAGLLWRGSGAMLAGALLGLFAAAEQPFTLAPTLATVLACIPFLVAYPLTIGAVTFRLSMRLSEKKQALQESEKLYRTTLDAMDAAVALFDKEDRLVLCNQDFQTLYAPIAPHLKPGVTFESLLRRAAQAGLVPQALGDKERWINERLLQHRQPGLPIQREFAGNRWRRIVEKRLPENALLAFSTDVTELVLREQLLCRMITERDAYAQALTEANQSLTRLSETDGLTGIANRRRFDLRLEEEWQRSRRHGFPVALLMIDIDHFKRFNDRYGHVQGDECLKQVASAMSSCAVRSTDLAARYGGEEFALLLPHADLGEASLIAERCIAALASKALPHEDSPTAPVVTVSIGVAAFKPQQSTEEPSRTLVEAADEALYRAKQSGRNRLVLAARSVQADHHQTLALPS